MKNILILILSLFVLYLVALITSCNGQTNSKNQIASKTYAKKVVGGGCDGCKLMYVDMPTILTSTDTSAGWADEGQKLLVSGTVFEIDGKTPVSNVIIYYWQTDINGYYSSKQGMSEETKRHGYIRGWLKTDEDGKYFLYTIRPAPYPNEKLPAHIHLAIKEPDINNEYYIDEINFDDDELLIPYLKKYPQENRGGSGVVRVLLKDDLQIAKHDIVLGLNIPNYPKRLSRENN